MYQFCKNVQCFNTQHCVSEYVYNVLHRYCWREERIEPTNCGDIPNHCLNGQYYDCFCLYLVALGELQKATITVRNITRNPLSFHINFFTDYQPDIRSLSKHYNLRLAAYIHVCTYKNLCV